MKSWFHPSSSKCQATLLHIHGLGEHSARHLNTIQALNAAGFAVLRFDLRGAGESEGRRQWINSFEEYLDDVDLAFKEAQKKGTPPYFLMGHSLGGSIAIHYAAKRDFSIFNGLVLSAPAFRVGKGVSPIKIWIGKKMEKFFPVLKIPAALDITAISKDLSIVEAYKKDPLNCSFNTVKQGNEILRALDEIPALCKKIEKPVWIAHGEDDRLVLSSGSEELMGYFASGDKHLEIFKGGFHELHNDIEKKDYFPKLIHWLDEHL